MEVRCYVYWIRKDSMTDIFNEGYVGISTDPATRLAQHKRNAKSNSHHKYKKEFREVLLSDDFKFELILCGTAEYCMEVERKLRPFLFIGWNRAEGGNGAFVYKHGLTDTKIAKAYYNMLTRAKTENEDVFPDWLGENGLVNFAEYYNLNLEIEGNYALIEFGKGYNPENFVKIPRSEVMIRAHRRYDIGDGNLYSAAELGKMFNMKGNTISVRVRDGWTIREAVGLDYRKPKRRPNVK